MALQQGRDLHIDAVLSGIMVGRRPPQGIVNALVPIIPVNKQSNIYMKSNYKEALQYVPGLTNRARGAKSREIYFTVSSDTYYAQNFALGGRWYDEEVVNADDPIRLRQRTARQVTDRLQLDYEARVASIANVSTNVFTTYHVATPWSNVTGSRPFSDLSDRVEDFREITTLRPNVLILPEQVAQKVRKSDEVRDILFGDRGGVATDDQIAALLKVERILVPEVFVNTVQPGQTAIGSGVANPVWGNKAFLAYVADLNGAEEQDTWITAFRWTDPSFGVPFAIRAFPHDDERRSQKVEASYYQQEKVISSDLGFAIDSVI
jgi:hypothetical protein